MNTSATLTFDVRVTHWITWCAFPGCDACIRNRADAKQLRTYCAEHAPIWQMFAAIDAPLHRAHQMLAFPKTRLGWCLT